jgi:predicted ribosome quality control (RQC) complex YloA/Tae2 family protein
MNPLALPVDVLARALGVDLKQMQDDLHVLAEAAARLPEVESELTRRMDEMEDTAEAGVAQLEQATKAAEAIVASLPIIEEGIAQMTRATKAAEALAGSIPTLERAADAGEKLAGEGLQEVRESRDALLEARSQADQLIAASERAQKALDRASDNVELALARAEPLQGVADRIARLNERLPGGRGGGA